MRRSTSLYLAAAIGLMAVAACSDVPVAPTHAARTPAAASLDRNGNHSDGTSSRFVIPARGGVVQVVIPALGDEPVYTLTFPAHAVCVGGDDLSTAPCRTVGHDVRVTATLYKVNGHAGVDFTPELRFDPSKVVTLSTMRMREAVLDMAERQSNQQDWSVFTLLYTPDAGATLIDDALLNPRFATHVDKETGRVWREIGHFSGYNMGTGNCDPTVDPTCPQ